MPAIAAEEAVDGSFVIADVRAPCEFAEGHVPGSVNVPFLDDAQRAVVGTTYKRAGAQAARVMAMDLVSRGLPVFLRSLALLTRGGDRLAVMCWRGGERSRNVVLLLALIGVHAARVEGGYRAYRRWVLQGLSAWRPRTARVHALRSHGLGKDGRLCEPWTPSPPRFRRVRTWWTSKAWLCTEALCWVVSTSPGSARRRTSTPWHGRPYVVPMATTLWWRAKAPRSAGSSSPSLWRQLVREGLPVLVKATPEQRAGLIMREYSPETWDAQDRARFRRSLSLIGSRLEPQRVASLRSAFEDGRFAEVVQELLVEYYDPLYQQSSVEGKHFLLDLEIGDDPSQDARALAAAITRHLEEQAPQHLV